MIIYKEYYVLTASNSETDFLTEDKDYTSQLEWAVKYKTFDDAQDVIESYKEMDKEDEFEYTGDYSFADSLRVRKVTISVE